MAYTSNGYESQIERLAKPPYPDAQEIKPMSAVGSAEYTMEQARDLSHRIQGLADRILGPIPTSATAAGMNGSERMGVFPLLQSSSERTQNVLNEGFDAINRIERSLP